MVGVNNFFRDKFSYSPLLTLMYLYIIPYLAQSTQCDWFRSMVYFVAHRTMNVHSVVYNYGDL